MVLDGRSSTATVPAGTPILDGAQRVRPDLPFACKGGVCGTCRARLTDGEVTMRRNYALEQDELDAGYVLTCQSLPASATRHRRLRRLATEEAGMPDLTSPGGDLEPIERASADELRALQLERLRWSLRHAYASVPHYRAAFDATGVHPDDCNDAGRPG